MTPVVTNVVPPTVAVLSARRRQEGDGYECGCLRGDTGVEPVLLTSRNMTFYAANATPNNTHTRACTHSRTGVVVAQVKVAAEPEADVWVLLYQAQKEPGVGAVVQVGAPGPDVHAAHDLEPAAHDGGVAEHNHGPILRISQLLPEPLHLRIVYPHLREEEGSTAVAFKRSWHTEYMRASSSGQKPSYLVGAVRIVPEARGPKTQENGRADVGPPKLALLKRLWSKRIMNGTWVGVIVGKPSMYTYRPQQLQHEVLPPAARPQDCPHPSQTPAPLNSTRKI